MGFAMTTGTTTLNAAFLAEIKDLNRELWLLLEKLRHVCSRPISMCSQSHELVHSVAKLRELVAMQFSLEEAFGYIEHAITVDPRFSARAEALRAAHGDLFQEISRLSELADELWIEQRLASLTTIVPVAFDRFYDAFLDHEHVERELLTETWLKEIGTGD